MECIQFWSSNPGRNTLVLGSVHGNEVCWSLAIDSCIKLMRNNVLPIVSGSVTFLPRANRYAYFAGKRFIDIDLNRLFGNNEIFTREHKVAQIIKAYISQADFVLDLHSIHAGDTPFVFLESTHPDAWGFVERAPLPYVLTGWEKLYKDQWTLDTIAYAESLGIPWVTVECGLHTSASSVQVAENMIQYALQNFWHIEGKVSSWVNDKKYIRVAQIVRRPLWAKFTKDWENFDHVRENTVIGISHDGSTTVAPYEWKIIIPNPNGIPWDEWFYFWRVQE